MKGWDVGELEGGGTAETLILVTADILRAGGQQQRVWTCSERVTEEEEDEEGLPSR